MLQICQLPEHKNSRRYDAVCLPWYAIEIENIMNVWVGRDEVGKRTFREIISVSGDVTLIGKFDSDRI